MYSCPECSLQYAYPSNLKRHIRLKHGNNSSKRLRMSQEDRKKPHYRIMEEMSDTESEASYSSTRNDTDDDSTEEMDDSHDDQTDDDNDDSELDDHLQDAKTILTDEMNYSKWMKNPNLLWQLFFDGENNHLVQCPGCGRENAKAFWFSRCSDCGKIHIYPKNTVKARLKCVECGSTFSTSNETCEHHIVICMDCTTCYGKSPSQFKTKPKKGYPVMTVKLNRDAEREKDIFD